MAEFLSTVWDEQGAFGELRFIGPDKLVVTREHPEGELRPDIRQEFVPVYDTDLAAELARIGNGPGWNAYFGVLPRVRESGKAIDVVDETHLLWADVDAKKFSDVLATGKAQALAAINAFHGPAAQILVDSGGGFHAYWLLTEYIPYEQARPVMAWIADAVGGDHVQDSPRVLRLPGTKNWKYGAAIDSRLLRFDESRHYRIRDFEALMPPPAVRRRQPGDTFERRDLPDWLVELIEDGAPQGQRSETCFKVCLWLLRYGRSNEEVRDIFAGYPEGIGAKYHEKGRGGDSWLDYTLRAAEEVA